MASYKIVNADQLDADLTAVADSIRAKGETTGELAFPVGFQEAVANISTGIDIQTKKGAFTLSNNKATVNCGFQPDMVAIDIGEANDAKAVAVAPFYEISADNVGEAGTYESVIWNDDNILIITTLSQTSTGFSVYMRAYDFSQDSQRLPTNTYNYVAVKYT